MEAQSPRNLSTTGTTKSRSSGLSDALILSGLSIIVVSLIFSWMATYDNPPDQDDFSEFNDPSEAYQNALEDHQDKIRGYEGIYYLFSSIGVVI